LVCLIVIQSNFDYAAGNVFVMKRSYHICENLYHLLLWMSISSTNHSMLYALSCFINITAKII
jgi:hypothetical protein